MMTTPCAHLIEREPPECELGMRIPEDCRGCSRYSPGLTDQERRRSLAWQSILMAIGMRGDDR
jgi:hypothetical protein